MPSARRQAGAYGVTDAPGPGAGACSSWCAPGACFAPRSRPNETAPATHTAATTAAPTGRVSPARAASVPALTHRPVSTAYSDQAARAVNSDSL